jgi:hypothetical protein
MRLKTQDGMRGARIAFLQEVSYPAGTRNALVEMVQQALGNVMSLAKTFKAVYFGWLG